MGMELVYSDGITALDSPNILHNLRVDLCFEKLTLKGKSCSKSKVSSINSLTGTWIILNRTYNTKMTLLFIE